MFVRHRYLNSGYILICIILLFLGVAAAQNPSASHFESLQRRLVSDGFGQTYIQDLYGNAKVYFDTKRVSLFFKHREASLNYNRFASKKSIRSARKYMKKYRMALLNAEEAYGVDHEIITAIILVETRLGTGTGNSYVLNILSTMSSLSDPVVREMFWGKIHKTSKISREKYDKWVDRKSKWAYTELKAFLKYTCREKINAVDVKGSYAGALGIAQFIPSSILSFAKDGNQDGRIDLFDHADAIASVANYLKRKGWHPNIGMEKARKVVWSYNHSSYYVDIIFKISDILKDKV